MELDDQGRYIHRIASQTEDDNLVKNWAERSGNIHNPNYKGKQYHPIQIKLEAAIKRVAQYEQELIPVHKAIKEKARELTILRQEAHRIVENLKINKKKMSVFQEMLEKKG